MKHKSLTILLLILFAFSCKTKNNQKGYQNEPELIEHSYSNPAEINPEHLNLSLNADFENKTLNGYAEWTISPNESANQAIFDIMDMEISKVEVDGEEVEFSLGDEIKIFGAPLIFPISNISKKVRIYYTTKPESEAIQWLSEEQTYGKPFLYTQSEAILCRSWIPCMDKPSHRFTFNAKIKCPEGLLALMSAENPQEKNSESEYEFVMTQPIPTYLMSLSIGDLAFASLGENCGVYCEPQILEQCKYEFEDLESMVATASKLYGNYQWGRYDLLILPASFPFGGMENPRLTYATPTIIAGDKSLLALVAHELAHSWSGNLVTNRSWADFWLNEGFTVYFEARIMEELYGLDYTDMLRKLDLEDLKITVDELMETKPEDTRLLIDLEGRNPDDGMTDIAYDKGRFFLQTIEEHVGREAFDNFLAQYFKEFSFKTISTEAFLNYLDEHLLNAIPGAKDSIGVNKWVFENGLPENCPDINSKYLNAVDSIIVVLENDNSKLNKEIFKGWTTHHYLYFLRNISDEYSSKNMAELDSILNFTSTHNDEIACDWFRLCVRNDYTIAQPEIENFLIKVGRRKFLRPLYRELLEQPKWHDFSKSVYAKAKNGYHSVSRNTIDKMFQDEFGS